jgi:deoxyadenosine/deoxycytidine kinase
MLMKKKINKEEILKKCFNINKNDILFIKIDGPIGVGKSFFIENLIKEIKNNCYLNKNIEIKIIEENLELFSDLFLNYCKNQKKYGFLFQNSIISSKYSKIMNYIQNIKDDIPKIILIDRTFDGDFIFCKVLNEKKFIFDCDLKLLENCKKNFDMNISNLIKTKKINLIETKILFTSKFKKTIINIKKRNRNGEKNYTKKYLLNIYKKHFDLLYKNYLLYDNNKFIY